VEQVYKEEAKDEEVAEGEYEEDQIKVEKEVQQVPPKTPNKIVQKNHPSDHIIRNKDARIETRRKICSPKQLHLALLSLIEPNNFEESIKDEF
jgi:hypothetical protein